MPYTDEQHEAIVKATVEREVAGATSTLTDRVSTLQNTVDVLEGEKASAEAAKTTAETALADEQAKALRAQEVAARRDARVASVKELADFGDDYYNDERVQRWAEKEDSEFATLLDDLADATVARLGLTVEQAQLLAPLTGEQRRAEIAKFVKAVREVQAEKTRGGTTIIHHETAAFRGGVPIGGGAPAPTGPTVPSNASPLAAFGQALRTRG